jgi:hypothetical protein
VLTQQAYDEPSSVQIVRVDDAAGSKLDSLAAVVDPGKVDVKGGLDDAKNGGYGIEMSIGFGCGAVDPVENIQGSITSEEDKVVRVDNCWNGCLAKEKELGEDANGFEDFGEDPKNLEKKELV